MTSGAKVIRWQEGRVDRTKEYFELRYGSAVSGSWTEWTPTALVGRPVDGILNVQFLGESSDPGKPDALKKVKKEIEFYFLELNERDPWLYAQCHCGTSANLNRKFTGHFSDLESEIKFKVKAE
jgi:hypothetical protein